MTVSWATRKHSERARERRDTEQTDKEEQNKKDRRKGTALYCTTPLLRFLITFIYASGNAERQQDNRQLGWKCTGSQHSLVSSITTKMQGRSVKTWATSSHNSTIFASTLFYHIVNFVAAAERDIENVALFLFWETLPLLLTTLQLKVWRIGCVDIDMITAQFKQDSTIRSSVDKKTCQIFTAEVLQVVTKTSPDLILAFREGDQLRSVQLPVSLAVWSRITLQLLIWTGAPL